MPLPFTGVQRKGKGRAAFGTSLLTAMLGLLLSIVGMAGCIFFCWLEITGRLDWLFGYGVREWWFVAIGGLIGILCGLCGVYAFHHLYLLKVGI